MTWARRWARRVPALGALLVLAVACAGGGTRESSARTPETTDVTSQGDVTVAGRVAEVLHARLFSIDDDTGGRILVVLEHEGTPIHVGQQVQVSGTVAALDPGQLVATFGVELPVEQQAGFAAVSVLVASLVTEADAPETRTPSIQR